MSGPWPYTFASLSGTVPASYIDDNFNAAALATDFVNLGNGTAGVPVLAFASDSTTGIYSPSVGALGITTDGVLRVTISATGDAIFTGDMYGSGSLFLNGTTAGLSLTTVNSTYGPRWSTAAYRAGITALQNGSELFSILAYGFDGTSAVLSAAITAKVDGTVGTGDMPSKLAFLTTPDGTTTITERVTIDNRGFMSVVSGSFGRGAPVTKTANFTVADNETWLINNKSGSSCTVTLPTASSWSGRELTITNEQAQTVVSASSNVVPLAGGAAGTAILAATAGRWATLVSNGTNWKIMQAG